MSTAALVVAALVRFRLFMVRLVGSGICVIVKVAWLSDRLALVVVSPILAVKETSEVSVLLLITTGTLVKVLPAGMLRPDWSGQCNECLPWLCRQKWMMVPEMASGSGLEVLMVNWPLSIPEDGTSKEVSAIEMVGGCSG